MKIRRLPEIDLARIAPLPENEQWVALRAHKSGRPEITYNPVRKILPDIINEVSPMLPMATRTSWERIELLIKSESASEEERLSNIAIARSIYGHAAQEALSGRRHDVVPLPLSIGIKVQYWAPIVAIGHAKPLFFFLDPRRSRKLMKLGRKFALSVMHEHIRVANPDYENVELAILQFGVGEEGKRPISLQTDRGIEFYTYDQLDQMIAVTYQIWEQVLAEREDEMRRESYRRRGTLI